LDSLARNRALIDGNKRLAWVATRLFLILNGSDAVVPDPPTGDQFVREVAQGKLDLAKIATTLREWAPPER
jgi:death on curing protein